MSSTTVDEHATHEGAGAGAGAPGIAGVDAALIVDAAFRRAHVCMAITDHDGVYLDVNDALCAFLGYSADQLRGTSFRAVTAPDDLVDGTAAMSALANGTARDFCLDKRYITSSGAMVWARTTGTAVTGTCGTLFRVIVQIEDLTMRRAVETALARRDRYDDLTGLANRRLFYERLHASLGLSPRAVRGLALLVINLDRFHQVNAGLGHAAGDLILDEAGRRVSAVVRGEDTVSRLGADEFAVLSLRMHSPLDAASLAIEIRESLERPYWADGNAVYVGARVGVVTNVHGDDAETLVQKAQAATELARSVTGRWSLHTDGANTSSRDEFAFVGDLRRAIADGSLTVAYQPIVDADGAVHHFEALARWNHPERGSVPPDQFIVLAEENGLIGDLTNLVLDLAIRQTVAWRAQGLPVSVAVNLSGKLLAEPDLVGQIGSILSGAGLAADALTLEITETAIAEGSSPALWAALDALRQTGIRISIDDFGTGYSSLSYLRQLPVDELKIDRSFILDLETDPRTGRIVRSIVDLAHSLGLRVVAEGVEDLAVADVLLGVGVDYLQGYAIARPMASAATTDWLRARSVAPSESVVPLVAPPRLGILVIDGAPAGRVELRKRLRARHHRVAQAQTCEAAVASLHKRLPDLVILDQATSLKNGLSTVPRLREAGYVGPIMLFSESAPSMLTGARFPSDVWPVSLHDETLLLSLIDGYAVSAGVTSRISHPAG